jgi:hypothetical protein
MEATLAVLNDLVARGVIEKYGIGGAVGAIFWVEPFDTIDLDVFVFLPADSPPLDPLRRVFADLHGRGYRFEGEFLLIEGVPVQFLPADDPKGLTQAALEKAVAVSYLGGAEPTPTWVLSPEYLIALALDVHRSKDYERVARLLNEAPVDRQLVSELIQRFGLAESWAVFARRYPEHS